MKRFRIYLMLLAVRLRSHRHRGSKERECDVCSKRFARIDEMEKHRRDVHPDMQPREAEV